MHGVFDFTTRTGYRVQFTAGSIRELPTIAARLDARGLACASLFFPGTYPPEPLAHGQLKLTAVNGARSKTVGELGAIGAEKDGRGTALFLQRVDQPPDQADQLALSLYGTLAAALTPGTYVTGEAASVSPLGGAYYRTMYLPPNNDGAASFLEKLRLMLVHEARGPKGLARGLELAFATPRAWLRDGESIAVHDAPTSFESKPHSYCRSIGRLISER